MNTDNIKINRLLLFIVRKLGDINIELIKKMYRVTGKKLYGLDQKTRSTTNGIINDALLKIDVFDIEDAEQEDIATLVSDLTEDPHKVVKIVDDTRIIQFVSDN